MQPTDGQYSHCTDAELAIFERNLSIKLNAAAENGEQKTWDFILDCLNLIELEKCRRQPRQQSNIAFLTAREIGGSL